MRRRIHRVAIPLVIAAIFVVALVASLFLGWQGFELIKHRFASAGPPPSAPESSGGQASSDQRTDDPNGPLARLERELGQFNLKNVAPDDLDAIQKYQKGLSRLEEQVGAPDLGDQDEVDRLKKEVSAKRAEAWENHLAMIDSGVDRLPSTADPARQMRALEDSIVELREVANIDDGKYAERDKKIIKLEGRLQQYKPTFKQVTDMLAAQTHAPLPIAGLAMSAFALSVLAILLGYWRLRRVVLATKELRIDVGDLQTGIGREIARLDYFDKKLREFAAPGKLEAKSPQEPGKKVVRPADSQRETDGFIGADEPLGSVRASWTGSRSPVAAPGSSPPAGPNGFIGTLAELQPFVPAANKLMEYDIVSDLLVDALTAPGFKYRVFADPATRELRVLPCVERPALQQQLYGFESVFDLEGPGPGLVSLIQHPQLEARGSGYRVLAKGRLRIG